MDEEDDSEPRDERECCFTCDGTGRIFVPGDPYPDICQDCDGRGYYY